MNILDEIKGIVRSKSMQDEELIEVYNTAKKVKGLILEIGSYRGVSTIMLAKGSNQKVIAVDPFIAHGEINDNLNNFLNNIKKYGVNDQIDLRQSFSKDVSIPGVISLLLIDGDHTYEGVKHDYLKFAPLVKQGGYIIMHDFHLPGIKKFFDEEIWPNLILFKSFKITTSLIVIQK